MLMPSGSRVELRNTSGTNVYESVDSSNLQLLDGGNGNLLLRSPDGSQLSYWSINSEYRCTEIKDRDGNYITIKYDPINGTANLGRVTSIIDTLGRTINFNYDTNYRLLSISQVWNGSTHVWASFGYTDLVIETNFTDGAPNYGGEEELTNPPTPQVLTDPPAPQVLGLPDNNTVSVLTQIGLDDGSRLNFDYSTWGQIYRIKHYARDGHELSHTAYDLPVDNSMPQTDCPRFSQRRDSAENWNNGAEAVTQYRYDTQDSTLETQMENSTWSQATLPDGTSYREYSTTDYINWRRGLVTKTEIYSADNQTTPKKTTLTEYGQDLNNVAYQLNPRVTATTISDSDGNRRRTAIEYTDYGLPFDVFEWGPLGTSDWTILRRTHMDYDLSPAYVNRHILGLAKGQYLFAPDVPNSFSAQMLMSKTTFEYDVDTGICTGLCADYAAAANSPSIVQHDNQNYGADFVVGRGALTRVRRWDAGDEWNESKRITSSMHYNTLGSAIRGSDPLGHQTTIGYADSFSDGNNSRNTFAYPTTLTDADGFQSFVQYNFDFGAKTRVQGPPPANQTQGVIQTFTYDSAARLQQVTTVNTGAYTRWVYPTSQTIVNQFTTIQEGQGEAYSATIFDGAGRARASASDFPNSTGRYSGSYTSYDIMGRAVLQTNPTEMNNNWTASGDDSVGWYASSQTYDWKGRPLVTTNQDNTQKSASYGGCGCAGGEVVTLTDEGTLVNGVTQYRRQKIYSDPLGRQWKTEVLNWSGTVYSTTANTYNARDQVTQVRQFQGPDTSGVYQDTTMTFDGYGRLQTRHVPEQQVDSNNSSSTDHTAWAYNADSTINSVTDARGVTTTFGYNARHLLTSVVNPQSLPIGVAATANVTFGYDPVGNRTSMSDQSGSTTYQYNSLSQVTSETHQLSGLSASYTLGYEYNLAGALKTFTDQTAGTSVSYGFDGIGRLTGVTGSGFGSVSQLASNSKYRASGALSHEEYGNGTEANLNYNNRMRVTHYALDGVKSLGTGQTLAEGADALYYNDGSLKFASNFHSDTLDSGIQDRAYTYDHAGRIATAVSGTEARDLRDSTNSNVADGPFKQIYTHDAWDNMVGRTGRFWSQDDIITASYDSHNRNSGWSYDADGNLLTMNDPSPNGFTPFQSPHHVYDAAANHIGVTQIFSQPAPTTGFNTTATSRSQTYDGNGQEVKRVDTTQINNYQPTTKTTYYVRSSVLGGQVVAHLDAQGVVQSSFVMARGTVLATRTQFASNIYVEWEHPNPLTGDTIKTGATAGWMEATHFDPQGVDVGESDPFPNGADQVLTLGDAGGGKIAPIGYGGGRSKCVLDGLETDCGFIRAEAAAACPSNDCGPRVLSGLDITLPTGVHISGPFFTDPFGAYADGSSGFGLLGSGPYGLLLPEGFHTTVSSEYAHAVGTAFLLDSLAFYLQKPRDKKRRSRRRSPWGGAVAGAGAVQYPNTSGNPSQKPVLNAKPPCEPNGSADVGVEAILPVFVGPKGGAQLDSKGIYPYFGLAAGTPGKGLAVSGTAGRQMVEPGISVGFSAAFIVGFSYSSGPITQPSFRQALRNGTWRFGGGTPGASANITVVLDSPRFVRRIWPCQ
jgi:YD repeat-containing protein